ncbi:chymotrypsin-1-like isoform X1 [Pieris napi]|uniref:chymotrypsin-1-like isoform X1 n=2 Tax=Pieris napi TaxID=78633 RepID=UPI001FB96456|nr:chymotrypsin-1-like isoform X1 [Pieris napi]
MYFKIAIVTFCLILKIEGGSTVQPYNVKDLLSSRIVGGIEASPSYVTHMVALVFGERFKWLTCGGSIITQRHILTAAHCIDPYIDRWSPTGLNPSLRGSIGSKYWVSTKYMIEFQGFVNHPNWNSFTIKNDIGILITKRHIQYNDAIQPIALNLKFIDRPVTTFVTGWGDLEVFGQTPDRLQMLITSTITSKQCVAAVRNYTSGTGVAAPPYDPKTEICTLLSKGHGMCHGDSGSALMTYYGLRKQIGIVSWGFPCARGAPDFFTRVSAFVNFIYDVVRPFSLEIH